MELGWGKASIDVSGPGVTGSMRSLGEAVWSPRLFEYTVMVAEHGREGHGQLQRSEVNDSGQANFTGLVLGCIEADFCKKICVRKLSPRSTQYSPLHRSKSRLFNNARILSKNVFFPQKFSQFCRILSFLQI